MEEKNELDGIAGWLILVAIGVISSPIRLLSTYAPMYQELYDKGVWGMITNPDLTSYNPLFASLLAGEFVYNLIVLGASLVLIFLFFKKHHFFPKLYIIVVLASVIFIPVDAWVVTLLFPDAPMFDAQTQQELIRVVVGGAIWIPYMLMSKRVKATFKQRSPNQALLPDAC